MEGKRKKNLTDLDESASFKPGTISRDDVLLIAHELGSSWEMVGRVLKLPDAVIDQIQADTDKVSKKCYRVLRRWQEMYPSNATYHRLALALKHPTVGRLDLVDKYCGLQLGKDVAVGTSSEPETTTQRVKGTKRKRNKNFTASDEEEYDVDEGEESIEEEKEDQPHEGKPTKKKEKKTGKVSKPLEDLVNDPSNSLDEICKRLDTPTPGHGNFENIAKHYGYDVFTVSSFSASPHGPSKAMILAIICKHPHVTVESFARVVVKQTSRENVAILLREFDCK